MKLAPICDVPEPIKRSSGLISAELLMNLVNIRTSAGTADTFLLSKIESLETNDSNLIVPSDSIVKLSASDTKRRSEDVNGLIIAIAPPDPLITALFSNNVPLTRFKSAFNVYIAPPPRTNLFSSTVGLIPIEPTLLLRKSVRTIFTTLCHAGTGGSMLGK